MVSPQRTPEETAREVAEATRGIFEGDLAEVELNEIRLGSELHEFDEARAARPTAAEEQAMTPQLALSMRAYRNARYHEDREAHYKRLNQAANFVLLILGSAAAASALATWASASAAAGFAVAVLGGLQLVYDLGGKASKHHELRAKFIGILAQSEMPNADMVDLNSRMVETYGDELEVFHAVNALAYNAAQKAFGRPDKAPIKVTGWQAKFRHWFTYTPDDFPDAQAAGPA